MKLRLHGANFTIEYIKSVHADSNREACRESVSGYLEKIFTDQDVHGPVMAFSTNTPEFFE